MKAFVILLLLGIVYSQCTGTETACPLKTGGKGCCPYERATCCEDMEHCCPNGYNCDVAKGACVHQGNEFLAFVGIMEQVKPLKVNSTEDIIKCVKDFIPLIKDGLRLYLDIKGAKVFDIATAIKSLITDEKVAVSDCAALFKNTSTDELRSNLEESGLYQYQGIEDIIKCVNDVVPLIKDGEKIVEDVETQNIEDLLTTLPRAITEAKAAYTDCSKITEVESFEQVKLTNMVQCVEDLIPLVADGKKIYEDIKNKQSPAEILADLTKLISEGEKAYADCTASYVSEVQDVQDIFKCVKDLIPVVEDGEKIYKAIQAKNLPEILSDLTQLVQDGKTAYADCANAFSKKQELTETIDVLKCVKDLIPVVADAKAVYSDVQTKDVTKIINDLKKLINDGQLAYTDCTKAFPQEVEVTVNPADIFKCIQDLAPLVKDGEKFAEDVKNKDYKDIVADLVQAVKDGKVAYEDCLKAFGQ